MNIKLRDLTHYAMVYRRPDNTGNNGESHMNVIFRNCSGGHKKRARPTGLITDTLPVLF